MDRRSHTRVRNAWMNGKLAGEWLILRNDVMEFQYVQSWLARGVWGSVRIGRYTN